MNKHFYRIFNKEWAEILGTRSARAEEILSMAPEEANIKITKTEILVDNVLIALRMDIPDEFYR